MRDNLWLETKLSFVWEKFFEDVPRLNKVSIRFGKRAKRRLASIRQTKRYHKFSDTMITVTGFFKLDDVPEYVVETTIAHELCHYAHGFASPLPQYSRFPHRGDLVDSELEKRGCGENLTRQKEWLESHWNNIVNDKIFLVKKRPHVQRRKSSSKTNLFFRLFGIS